MKTRNHPAVDLALVAVFAALIAVCTVVGGVELPFGVALTLQTLGVVLTGLVLGPWRGFLAVLLYLVVGFAGLPIFSEGSGGLGVLASPSMGYLLAFPFGALAAGALAALSVRRGLKGRYIWITLSGLVASLIVIGIPGIVGMSVIAQVDLVTAFIWNLAFVPGDAIKCVIAGIIAAAVNKAFPALLAAPQPAAISA
ncbi:MAG: biotin transporter BioY [Propionibacteriaceae bacterium]|nr:biotin transporter BioY [Propionibacteriaceae bacterium]